MGFKYHTEYQSKAYCPDATGNILATYDYKSPDGKSAPEITFADLTLYGSARLGLLTVNKTQADLPASDFTQRVLGNKMFEFTNHLGNVSK